VIGLRLSGSLNSHTVTEGSLAFLLFIFDPPLLPFPLSPLQAVRKTALTMDKPKNFTNFMVFILLLELLIIF
jgi:hypothetical protein